MLKKVVCTVLGLMLAIIIFDIVEETMQAPIADSYTLGTFEAVYGNPRITSKTEGQYARVYIRSDQRLTRSFYWQYVYDPHEIVSQTSRNQCVYVEITEYRKQHPQRDWFRWHWLEYTIVGPCSTSANKETT